MLALEKRVDELLEKIEKLVEQYTALNSTVENLRSENRELKNKIENYKAEIQQLKGSSNPVQTAEQNSEEVNKARLRDELAQYIEELDGCIDKLKQL